MTEVIGNKNIAENESCQAVSGLTMAEAGFVYLDEVIPNAVLDIRYASEYNFTGHCVDGYFASRPSMTREGAAALSCVADRARKSGYRLLIYDAYRPQRAVDAFIRWSCDPLAEGLKKEFYPELEKSRIFAEGFLSAHSGHSRGSTVDLTLCRGDGTPLDMGGPFDFFGAVSRRDYTGLTEEQYCNRELLKDIMAGCGFRYIRSEWWHFTLKDEPYPDTYFNFPVE